jgi:hypothetical protein
MSDIVATELKFRRKRGEIREDGKIFWSYQIGYKNNERWIDCNQFKLYKEIEKRNQIKRRKEKKSQINVYFKKWRLKNKNKFNLIRKKYRNKRRASDFVFLLKERVRNLTTQAFRVKKYSKKSQTHQMLGCSWDFLKEYIEKKFQSGMTWENKNLWHIDHIIPLSSAKTHDDLATLLHYTNLQPLWATDNLKKKNKIIY